jgi:hypothetical protein
MGDPPLQGDPGEVLVLLEEPLKLPGLYPSGLDVELGTVTIVELHPSPLGVPNPEVDPLPVDADVQEPSFNPQP